MGERLGGVGHDGWEMRHVLLACDMRVGEELLYSLHHVSCWMVRTIRQARLRTSHRER